MKHLKLKAWLALAALAAVMALLIFGSAGTTSYWQGWAYLAVFFAAGVVMTIDLMRHDPALLERRMSGGPTAEQRPVQKLIMWCTSLAFIALLVVPALDYRFRGATLPAAASVAGNLLVAIGFWFIFFVYRENTFTSATIELAADQHVVSTGPYAIVRHPMYASASLYVLGTPLALGSLRGFVPAAALIAFVIWRMFDEERFLAQNLHGYAAYQQRVRHRLIPFLW